ncbi:MAG: nucleotide exchange factor GrpE [Deltaproteobacteria bacterium]|nr:nucleotide exchange factor GrpE [Deltaproteobacteria bacterium]MDQ3297389.1 nucleotide exchange factor GrpE [Myxococcota bacterium]
MESTWGPAFVTEATAEPEVPEIDELALDDDDDAVAEQRAPHTQRERSVASAVRELEAAKARVERDAGRVEDETRFRLVSELIPVLDNLDRTIAAAEQQDDAQTVIEGVRLVRRQLEKVLAGYGVTRIQAKGHPFDPAVHEAVSVIAVREPRHHGIVIDQLEPGYRAGDRLLRAAKVVVGRAARA